VNVDFIKIALEPSIRQFVDRRSQKRNVSPQQTITELVNLGFEALLQQYYERYQRGEISFGRVAEELGITSWELSHLIEQRGWTPHNLPSGR
jgi:predicted HTH domain antitoxin